MSKQTNSGDSYQDCQQTTELRAGNMSQRVLSRAPSARPQPSAGVREERQEQQSGLAPGFARVSSAPGTASAQGKEAAKAAIREFENAGIRHQQKGKVGSVLGNFVLDHCWCELLVHRTKLRTLCMTCTHALYGPGERGETNAQASGQGILRQMQTHCVLKCVQIFTQRRQQRDV